MWAVQYGEYEQGPNPSIIILNFNSFYSCTRFPCFDIISSKLNNENTLNTMWDANVSWTFNFTSERPILLLTCPPMVTSKNTIGLLGFVGWTFIVIYLLKQSNVWLTIQCTCVYPCGLKHQSLVTVLRWPARPNVRVLWKDKTQHQQRRGFVAIPRETCNISGVRVKTLCLHRCCFLSQKWH